MKKVDNASLLTFLENENLTKNYYECVNIVNAGKPSYAIKSVSYFTKDGTPSSCYISLCENIYNELTVEIKTDDIDLIYDAFCELRKTSRKYKTIRMGADSSDFFETQVFKKFCKIKKIYTGEYGVFAQLSKDDIPKINIPENIKVELVTETEKSQFITYDNKVWDGLSSLIKYGNDTDRLFLIKENDYICGYLVANNSYGNIYDIAHIFVSEEHRGKNFGKYLTVTLSKYCYDKGYIPHYGIAVSKPSEAVAIKRGFAEIYRRHYVDVIFRFLTR